MHVCPRDDLHMFYPSASDGRSNLIQTTELNCPDVELFMKSSMFGLGLTKKINTTIVGILTLQNFISLSLKCNYIILNNQNAFDGKGSLHCSLLLVCNKCSLHLRIKIQSIYPRIALGLTITKLTFFR